MKKQMINVWILAMAITAASCGGNNNTSEKDSKEVAEEQNEKKFEDTNLEDDAEFVVAAADGGLLEVKLGELAQTNAASNKIKKFAKNMIEDHSKANEELKALASQKNITIPDKLGENNQKDYNDLAEKKGKDFDKAYSDFMVKDHKEDIDNFKDEAENGKNIDLKTWAAGKIPVLEHHLHMAESVRDSTNK